jgi:peroxiredoxin family protein
MTMPRGWIWMVIIIPAFVVLMWGTVSHAVSINSIHKYLDSEEVKFVTLWEMMTLQKVPYAEIKHRQIKYNFQEMKNRIDYKNGVDQ